MTAVNHFPDDENGAVLRRMAESGDDLSRPRKIDFTVVLPDEEAARKFAARFVDAGYETKAEQSGTVPELPWDVLVTKHMVADHADITAFEEELERTALPLGGRHDGWGCFERSSSFH